MLSLVLVVVAPLFGGCSFGACGGRPCLLRRWLLLPAVVVVVAALAPFVLVVALAFFVCGGPCLLVVVVDALLCGGGVLCVFVFPCKPNHQHQASFLFRGFSRLLLFDKHQRKTRAKPPPQPQEATTTKEGKDSHHRQKEARAATSAALIGSDFTCESSSRITRRDSKRTSRKEMYSVRGQSLQRIFSDLNVNGNLMANEPKKGVVHRSPSQFVWNVSRLVRFVSRCHH